MASFHQHAKLTAGCPGLHAAYSGRSGAHQGPTRPPWRTRPFPHRVLLRGSRVVAVDEGTANLDPASDAAIQAALTKLRQPGPTGGAGCSLIVVAHRLDTVAASDQMLVMSQGRVIEQGPPAELAAAPRGVYASMLRARAGAAVAASAGRG